MDGAPQPINATPSLAQCIHRLGAVGAKSTVWMSTVDNAGLRLWEFHVNLGGFTA